MIVLGEGRERKEKKFRLDGIGSIIISLQLIYFYKLNPKLKCASTS
jgi:hypothetical protein